MPIDAQFQQTWLDAFWRPEMPHVLGYGVLLALLLWRFLAHERRVLRNTLIFFALCLLAQGIGAALQAGNFPNGGSSVQELAIVASGLALIRLSGLLLFRVVLPGLKITTPRILEDILVILAYVVWGMVRLRLAGLDLSHVVATSAVITAVIAFSMQDTLGNILGGLALQLDNSITLDDWVKVDDLSGRVVEIRWRYTAIETRNGEIVIVPNSALMKTRFMRIGSAGEHFRWRRWVWFNVGFATPPARVIAAVETALGRADIANVAREPAVSCVLMDFAEGYGRYALRYWLTDPRPDDPTDSAVRAHVYAALQRNGMRLAVPERDIHVTKENEAHKEARDSRELARRQAALASAELFAGLNDDERAEIARRLVFAPFVKGDAMTRQGAVAHWLYFIVAGEAEVWLESADGERRLLNTLTPGGFFGEMGLLTGEPRRATVIAKSDCECYRLDKAGLEDIIHSRPAIAEELSRVLANRAAAIAQAQSDLSSRQPAGSASHATILGRIRAFFGLNGDLL